MVGVPTFEAKSENFLKYSVSLVESSFSLFQKSVSLSELSVSLSESSGLSEKSFSASVSYLALQAAQTVFLATLS